MFLGKQPFVCDETLKEVVFFRKLALCLQYDLQKLFFSFGELVCFQQFLPYKNLGNFM